jgi:LPXTG-motif cell wall-anchored protein
MDGKKFAAILLIGIGALALIYGGVTYTKDVHQVDVGSLHMSVDEKQHITIPVWAGIGALVAGGLLLSLRRKS